MASNTVDITTSQTPATDTNFSERVVNTITGPTPILAPNLSLEANAVQPPQPKDAAIWKPLTAFDNDVKAALKEFVDTTMEGVKYSQSFSGRAKIVDFFFYGTSTKSVRPSEVGHFRLVISYPPNITSNVGALATA